MSVLGWKEWFEFEDVGAIGVYRVEMALMRYHFFPFRSGSTRWRRPRCDTLLISVLAALSLKTSASVTGVHGRNTFTFSLITKSLSYDRLTDNTNTKKKNAWLNNSSACKWPRHERLQMSHTQQSNQYRSLQLVLLPIRITIYLSVLRLVYTECFAI